MRIQDTNNILNEARVQRNAHQREIAGSRWNTFSNMLRSRRTTLGIAGAVAAGVGIGMYLFSRRRELSFDFS